MFPVTNEPLDHLPTSGKNTVGSWAAQDIFIFLKTSKFKSRNDLLDVHPDGPRFHPLSPVLAIVTPVRGEARYLLEWIAYHRALGIDTFLIADNGGDDNTSELLQELDRHHLVKRFDWRKKIKFQLEFYCQALNFARDWPSIGRSTAPQAGSGITRSGDRTLYAPRAARILGPQAR